MFAQPAAAANAAASLSQCTNGTVGPPLSPQPCVGSNTAGVSVAITGINGGAATSYKNWVNGNSNGSKSHWREGEFISYRTVLTGLSAGTHHLVFTYDTVHSGGHALDYLGSYDATEQTTPGTTSVGTAIIHANNNSPCSDLVSANQMPSAWCGTTYNSSRVQTSPANPVVTTAAPHENFGSGAGGEQGCGGAGGTFSGTQQAGTIDLFGPSGSTMGPAAITSDNAPSGTGQCTSTVSLTFSIPSALTSTQSVVIAWGGHIASSKDWGAGNAATGISGSPYHMALSTLDGASTGSQDRALSTTAIFFQPTLTTALSPSGPVTTGTPVTDTATLSGSVSGSTGAITINVYSGNTSSVCTGTPVASATATPATNGDGNYSATFNNLAAGNYEFQAVYAGDASTNTEPATSACGTEPLTVGAPQVTVTKTADAASVNAGDQIGFTVTIANAGSGVAHGVTLSDPLPGGTPGPVTWSIDGSTGNPAAFSLSGAAGSQTLSLAGQPIDLAAGASLSVHITAQTSATACGTYNNTASVTTTNDGNPTASASTVCNQASIHILKTADASTVNAGDQIGFTVTVTNSGAGTATGVTVNDPLPAGSGSGVTWTIESQSNPGLCSVNPTAPQTLSCGPTSLASGASFTVHITAQTSAAECSTYNNTATVTTTNDGTDNSGASITCNQQVVSQITPTATTCSQFSSGTSATLSAVQYSVKSGKISQVNPGVFFYWVKVQATAGSNTVMINQAITTGNFNTFFAFTSGSNVFTAGCVAVSGATFTQAGGVTTIKFTAASAGTYIIGVKYSTSAVVGKTAPSPTTVHYTFTEDSHSNTTQGLDLTKK
jgi:uncharacterized repeat protein (TIGR01451 family)